MKVLSDVTSITSFVDNTGDTDSDYPVNNVIDYTNFKEWRSESTGLQNIRFNFTGSISVVCLFGCNFNKVNIVNGAGSVELQKDPLLGDYRGFFVGSSTSEFNLVIYADGSAGQVAEDSYFKMSAIIIGNDTTINNVVYPLNTQLVNPSRSNRLASLNVKKKSWGHNYRLIEILRKNLDIDGVNVLAEIKRSLGRGQTFVIFFDDGNIGECYLGTRIEPFEYKELSNDNAEDSLILEETGGKLINYRLMCQIVGESDFYNYSSETWKLPTSPAQPKGKIISAGTAEDELADNFSQQTRLSGTTLVLDNLDGEIKTINDKEDLRGRIVKIWLADVDTGDAKSSNTYTVKKISFSPPTRASLTLERSDLALWHIMHPVQQFNLDGYGDNTPPDSNAIGKTIPLYYGQNYNIPLYYIWRNYTSDVYIYQTSLLRTTNSSIDNVYRDLELVDSGEWTAALPYKTSINFTLEQLSFASTLHNMTADIKGHVTTSFGYTENPVECFQDWLTYQVGITCDTTSFSAAATVADNLGLKLGGGIFGELEATDWKDQFLLACRGARFFKGVDGQYEIEIPEYQSTTDADFTPDNMEIISDETTSTDTFVNTIIVNYYLNLSNGKYGYVNEQTCGRNYGTTKEYNLRFVNDHATASRITQYLKNKFLGNDRTIVFRTGQDAGNLKNGDIIGVTHFNPQLDDARFEIKSIKRIKSNNYYYSKFILK